MYIGMGSMMNCMFDAPEQHKFAKMWVDGVNQLKKRAIVALTGFAEADKFIASIPKQENILFLQQSKSMSQHRYARINISKFRYSPLVAVPEMLRGGSSRWRGHSAQWIVVRSAVVYCK